MKGKKALCFWSIVFFCAAHTLQARAQNTQFNLLKQKFSSGQVFQANFSHELTDAYTGDVINSSGRIWIGNQAYKLESDGQILVVDGNTSRVYDQNRNRVIIDNYLPEDDDFAPSRLLQGVDSSYVITEEKAQNGTRILMESDDYFSLFTSIEILIDNRLNPISITARDISDNKIVTVFSEGTFVAKAPDLFSLSHPDNAEIVDLRY